MIGEGNREIIYYIGTWNNFFNLLQNRAYVSIFNKSLKLLKKLKKKKINSINMKNVI